MKARIKRVRHIRLIEDGSRLRIRLAQGVDAIVDTVDFDDLMRRGFSDQWLINENSRGCGYVRVAGPTNMLNVARLIVCAEPGAAVKYVDGNRLNLTRDNLSVHLKRGGKRKSIEAAAVDYFPANREAALRQVASRLPLRLMRSHAQRQDFHRLVAQAS